MYDPINMDVIKKCNHRFNGQEACSRKVSKKDPEGLFCAEHRICVLAVEAETRTTTKPAEEKYLDFETFTASLI